MEIKQIEINKIKPYELNAKKHPQTQIDNVAKSIEEFGWQQPIVLDSNNVIIIGHCRFMAAKKLKLEEVPCTYYNGTEEQVKKLRLIDNKTNESDWDIELLLQDMENLKFEGYDLDWGLPEEEEKKEVEEDNFDVDKEIEEIEEPVSKLGDIYQLGEHRLMCGDSTSEDDVEKLMDGNVVDLVVTDPPYNVDYGSKAEAINKYGYKFSDRHIKNDYMPQEQFIDFLDKAFHNMNWALKDGGAFYIWHASITVFEFETALRLNNLKTRQQLIWVKNALVLGRQDYQWIHEPCLYGWKEGAAHYFIDDRTLVTVIEDEPLKDLNKMKKDDLVKVLSQILDGNTPSTIIRCDKPVKSAEHPTMKPLKLLSHLIGNSSRPGESVLDLFGGSGSTLMTCEQLGRKSYTMEYDPKYVDVIIKRWETFTGRKAVKLNV